jgi:3-methyladenine DNA glycosylase AlkD
MDAHTLDAWADALDSYVLADAFSALVGRTPHAAEKAQHWIGSKREFVGQTGWNVVAMRAAAETEMHDEDFERLLAKIEADIHASPNRVRHAMNQALIAIGARSARLEKRALAAAERIGRVEVDHGETGCRTPDARAYIAKGRSHRARRKGKARA